MSSAEVILNTNDIMTKDGEVATYGDPWREQGVRWRDWRTSGDLMSDNIRIALHTTGGSSLSITVVLSGSRAELLSLLREGVRLLEYKHRGAL